MRSMLRLFLEDNGYDVAEAEQGEMALQLLSVIHPAIILMDAKMPVMDGFATCAEIQKRFSERKIPVVMLTALESAESVDQAFAVGAEEYITKPIHWPILRQRIRKILEHRSMAETLRKSHEEVEIRRQRRTMALLQVNEARHIREERFRSLVEASPNTILILDEKGEICFINHAPPGAVTDDEWLGTVMVHKLPPSSRHRFQVALDKLFKQKRPDAFQLEGPSVTWWKIEMTPLTNRKERYSPLAMVMVVDRTEQHNTQIQAMRNARLATVGTLAASVAHEINNPNNAILLQASWLAKVWPELQAIIEGHEVPCVDVILGGRSFQKAIERVSECIPSIVENSRRIGRIVSNLKQISKPDDGTLQENIQIHKVLASVLSILANQVNTYCASCHVEAEQNLPQVRGNRQQLEQVFINLILNALQALPDRKRKVRIDAWYDEEMQKVAVNIQDEGIGIPEENLEKILLPFFTTKLAQGGTGLGLAICQSILSKHEGCMEIDSVAGRGTTVRVNLPITPSCSGKRP